jgi:hypothetical protein
MAGVKYHYFDGYLKVDFQQSRGMGDIEIIFQIFGGVTVIMRGDENFHKGRPRVFEAQEVYLKCWTSESESRYFRDMVCWLEAVTCDVRECSFLWTGEGPDGELRWFNRRDDSGMLKLDWTGGYKSEPFTHEVRLDKHQMVKSLYESFRHFVESDRYDPLEYERLCLGEVFDLVVIEGRQAFAHEVALREQMDAHALLQTILQYAFRKEQRKSRQVSLTDFVQRSGAYWEGHSSDDQSVIQTMTRDLGQDWNCWSFERRQKQVEEELFPSGFFHCSGENLRQLRSPLIESWLVKQSNVDKSSHR